MASVDHVFIPVDQNRQGYLAKGSLRLRQPFSHLTYIPSAEELIQIAFRRASKAEVQFSDKDTSIMKARKRETTRIKTVPFTLINGLRGVIKEMPRLDTIHPFYNELANAIIGIDKLKKNLGALNWAANMIGELSRRDLYKMREVRNKGEAARIRREYYGRVASIMRQISPNLKLLEDARKELRRIPTINLEDSTITLVVAGYVNVGKSTYVKTVSSANPTIEPYPFTTKGLVLGHRETRYGTMQIVDTPGLLDRPLPERNKIELQAIIALKYLAKAVIFLFDPSMTCGYDFKKQMNLYHEVINQFKDVQVIPVFNKIDLLNSKMIAEAKKLLGTDVMLMSAGNNIGVQEVLETALEKAVKEK
jgi:nucleolar GTP-binding protein